MLLPGRGGSRMRRRELGFGSLFAGNSVRPWRSSCKIAELNAGDKRSAPPVMLAHCRPALGSRCSRIPGPSAIHSGPSSEYRTKAAQHLHPTKPLVAHRRIGQSPWPCPRNSTMAMFPGIGSSTKWEAEGDEKHLASSNTRLKPKTDSIPLARATAKPPRATGIARGYHPATNHTWNGFSAKALSNTLVALVTVAAYAGRCTSRHAGLLPPFPLSLLVPGVHSFRSPNGGRLQHVAKLLREGLLVVLGRRSHDDNVFEGQNLSEVARVVWDICQVVWAGLSCVSREFEREKAILLILGRDPSRRSPTGAKTGSVMSYHIFLL